MKIIHKITHKVLYDLMDKKELFQIDNLESSAKFTRMMANKKYLKEYIDSSGEKCYKSLSESILSLNENELKEVYMFLLKLEK